jgi:hypothetical protein
MLLSYEEALSLIWMALVWLFRSRASLAAEILILRHQINILRRHSAKRQTFSAVDRLIFAELYRLAPTVLNAFAREPPSQGWKTFLHNHADRIAAMDLFVVPAISFRLLYGF